MPSLPGVMLHGLIKSRMEKIKNSIQAAETNEEKVAIYRRDLTLDVGSLVLGDCKAEDSELAGRPATWITSDSFPADRMILFLHGGGYVGGSVFYSRNQAADIAKAAGRKLVSLDYRLAPEAPWPAALQDVLAAWRSLLADGYEASSISLVGFSAGGGLALASVLAMRQENLPLPGAVVGLSPWCDLTLRQITIKANSGKDIMISPEFLEVAASLYTAGHDRADPLISPLFGDLTGFPPLLLQVAAEELLLGEVIALADKADKSGVEVSLEIYDGMWHVWQSMNELLPEARSALDHVGGFIRQWSAPAAAAVLEPASPGINL